jgi:hypothetical protein
MRARKKLFVDGCDWLEESIVVQDTKAKGSEGQGLKGRISKL